jgi:hypothetical protein
MKSEADVQQDAQHIAQSDTADAEIGASVSMPEFEPSTKRNGRDRRGKFARGNTFAVRHGRFSRAVAHALLPEQVDVLQQLADREGQILADLGGATELSLFERDLTVTYQQLHALKEFNVPSMFRSRGRVRQQAIDAFMSAIDRQLKIISQLGLKRRQKNISDLSLEEYLQTLDRSEQGSIDGGNTTEHQQED